MSKSPEERAVARREEIPIKEIVEHRVEIHGERSRLLMALVWLWGAAVTAGMLYLATK